jgi:methionine sulfoxide reductase heme-binding subunit
MGSLTSTPAWYLMRGSGVVTLILLTGVVVLGIATSNRAQLGRLPRFVTLGLHRSISLLAVVFLAIHVVTAIVDPYASVRVLQIVLPLPYGPYPLWLALGALSLDVLAAVIVTSLLRQHLSLRVWKTVHWLSYASWPLAFTHSIGIGTDKSSAWFLGVAITCTAAIVAATAWRLAGSGSALPKHLGSPLSPVGERTG